VQRIHAVLFHHGAPALGAGTLRTGPGVDALRAAAAEWLSPAGQLQLATALEVLARPTLASEAERLGIRPGGAVLTIARTYHTAERPVEAADIVIPVERYSLVYEVPVG
jgi:hypothetical protein